jgi:hypothetical protein
LAPRAELRFEGVDFNATFELVTQVRGVTTDPIVTRVRGAENK